MCRVQTRQMHGDRKWIRGCPRQRGRDWRWGLSGTGASFQSDENVLKLIVVTAAQLCESIKNHWLVYFKWVDCVACESRCQKAVRYKKNTFKDARSPWFTRLPKRNKTREKNTLPKMLFRIFYYGMAEAGKWQRGLDLHSFWPAWHMWNQRALSVSSTGSSFAVITTAAERAKVHNLPGEWMNEWMNERASTLPSPWPLLSIHPIAFEWMLHSFLHEDYSCFFTLLRVLISLKPQQKPWSCHTLGLWHDFHSWASVSPSMKGRAC